MKPIRTNEVEMCVADLMGYRSNVIVPNVSWGLGLNHECDLLALDMKARFTEVEIKVSASDLKADFKKGHGHRSKYISRLVYAMPDYLIDSHGELIPQGCGIIGVRRNRAGNLKAYWHRQCRHKEVEPLPLKILQKFMHLGCMRIWTLKKHIRSVVNDYEFIKKSLQEEKARSKHDGSLGGQQAQDDKGA